MFKEIRQNDKSIVKVMKNGSIIWQKPNPVILPAGYIECEYLISSYSGTVARTYIDTGIVPNDTTGYSIDLSLIDVIRDMFAFGSRNYASTDSRFLFGPYNGYLYYGYGVTYSNNKVWRIEPNVRFVANFNFMNSRLADVNGLNQYKIPNTADFRPIYSMFIMTAQITGKATYSLGGNLYGCKISQDNVLIQNLIPCLDNLGVPCMYDTVSKTTFYNQGTGTFGYKIKEEI